jgi:hypothetical protein
MIARGMTTLTGDKDPRDKLRALLQRAGFRRHQGERVGRARRDVDAPKWWRRSPET